MAFSTFSTFSHFTNKQYPARTLRESHEFELLGDMTMRYDPSVDSFQTYARNHNLDRDDLARGHLPPGNLDETASSLQHWLFFGLFYCVSEVALLHKYIRIYEDLVFQDNTGQSYLTITRVPYLVRYWIANEPVGKINQEVSNAEFDRRCLTAKNYLDDTKEMVIAMQRSIQNNRRRVETRCISKVLLSICLLWEELAKAMMHVYPGYLYVYKPGSPYTMATEWTFAQFSTFREQSPILQDLLRDSGWCHQDVRRIINQGGEFLTTRMYHLSKLRRGIGMRDHSGCAGEACTARSANADGGVLVHEDNNCTCEPREEKFRISRIVEQGGVPVLTVREAGDGQTTLTVEPSMPRTSLPLVVGRVWGKISEKVSPSSPLNFSYKKAQTARKPYVAISHVGADGLGDADTNTILPCQLLKIQGLVNQLYSPKLWPVPFWIDTICVPATSELKRSAMEMMVSIYEEADKVLVFDSTLSSAVFRSDPEELLARIRYSRWTQRLWTFQEAVFAKELWFQFKGGAHRMEGLLGKYRSDHYQAMKDPLGGFNNSEAFSDAFRKRFAYPIRNIDQYTIESRRGMGFGFKVESVHDQEGARITTYICNNIADYSVSDMMRDIEEFRNNLLPDTKRTRKWAHFAAICAQVGWRCATQPADEPYCLAALLGIDPKVVLEDPTHASNSMEVLASNKPETARDNQMARIYEHFELFPTSVIFARLPRLPVAGLKWAPSSFLGAKNRAIFSADSYIRVAHIEDGLGAILLAPARDLWVPRELPLGTARDIYFDEYGITFKVSLSESASDSAFDIAAGEKSGKGRYLTLILEDDLAITSTYCRAVLLSDVHTKSEKEWGVFEARVDIQRLDRGTYFNRELLFSTSKSKTIWVIQ